MKVEEYMLNELKIPALTKLSTQERQTLLETFNKVKYVKPPSILEQLKNRFWARVLIDKTWLQVLGYKDDIDDFLNRLYDSLTNEIELLKKLMAEGATEESEF